MKDQHPVFLGETRIRLREWGMWCHLILTLNLSFPHQSLMGRLAEMQDIPMSHTYGQCLPENARAEEVDALVNLYAEECTEKAHLLLNQYATQGSPQEKIARMNLPRHIYYRYLKSAEHWIHQHL